MLLRLYLTRLFLARMLVSLLGLSAIIQLLNLLDKTGDILAHGGVADIGRYVALRFPTIVAEMLPLASLLGALLAFRQLSGGMEVTAMRAAGISLGQILRALVPACLAISVLQFVLQTEIGPRAEVALAAWWAQTIPPDPGDPPPPRLWLESHGDIAAVDQISGDGRILKNILVVQRNPAGDLVDWLNARRAQYTNGQWTLQDVRIATPSEDAIRMAAAMPWPHGPAPANMVALTLPVDDMPLGRLIAILRGHWTGARGPAFYWTALQNALAALVDPFLMLLLATPVLVAPPRAEGAGAKAALALILGLGYMVAAGLLSALGDAGTLSPVVAAWGGTVIFGGIGLSRLLWLEDG
jgi:lipopolysaccharide export system permease protein